jgi:hypothetical protein
MRPVLASALVGLGLAVLTAPAAAVQAPPGTVTLSDNHAGAFSRLFVSFNGQASSAGTKPPQALFIDFPRGGKFDLRGRKTRCLPEQASASKCPADARIGTGSVQGSASGPSGLLGPGVRQDFNVSVELFVASPTHPGDLADIVAEFREPKFSISRSGRARVLSLPSGPFEVEVQVDQFPTTSLPPGTTVEVSKAELNVGGTRTVRKVRRKRVRRHGKIRRRRVVRKRRYSVITNPPTCTGTWAAQVRVRYSDRTDTYDAALPCQAAAKG